VRAYVADAILCHSKQFHRNHALIVDHKSHILEVLPADSLETDIEQVHLAGKILTASPVLAHAHLESFDAPSNNWDASSFSGWVADLLSWRASSNRLSPLESAQKSCKLLLAKGCGLVATHCAEVGAEGAHESQLPEVFLWNEYFDPSGSEKLPSSNIALHAPYSVDDGVARKIFKLCDEENIVSIHLGEHKEERDFLSTGSGPLADLFREKGRSLKEKQYASPVEWLREVGGLKKGVVVVHAGDLSSSELMTLHNHGVDVVFCPGTHLYFSRNRPSFGDVPEVLPALGCDSMASNKTLDPLYELRSAYHLIPEKKPEDWWESLTERGAEVLRRSDLGKLEKGFLARVLLLDNQELGFPEDAEQLCKILCNKEDISVEVRALN